MPWGSLKGVGKVYVQVVVDTFCSIAFAKCYSSKIPVTACDLLCERVLRFETDAEHNPESLPAAEQAAAFKSKSA